MAGRQTNLIFTEPVLCKCQWRTQGALSSSVQYMRRICFRPFRCHRPRHRQTSVPCRSMRILTWWCRPGHPDQQDLPTKSPNPIEPHRDRAEFFQTQVPVCGRPLTRRNTSLPPTPRSSSAAPCPPLSRFLPPFGPSAITERQPKAAGHDCWPSLPAKPSYPGLACSSVDSATKTLAEAMPQAYDFAHLPTSPDSVSVRLFIAESSAGCESRG